MQTTSVNQSSTTAPVSMQSSIPTAPMPVISNITNPLTNMLSSVAAHRTGIMQPIPPYIHISNVRPGTLTEVKQKSVSAIQQTRVIILPQVVGAQCIPDRIKVQTTQSYQPGQQGHLLLENDSGQYQLLRVISTAPVSVQVVPSLQTIGLPASARSGVEVLSTSLPEETVAKQFPPIKPMLYYDNDKTILASATLPQQRKQTVSDDFKSCLIMKQKCRNFLANLLDLSRNEPQLVGINVQKLIQELINGQTEPQNFCERLENLLQASPQPGLSTFLEKSLPLLRHALMTKELVIEGINPPTQNVNILSNTTVVPKNLRTKTDKKTSILQNIPVHCEYFMNKASNGNNMITTNIQRPTMVSPALTTDVPASNKPKDKNFTGILSLPHYTDGKVIDEDDINDITAMGGLNLAEETLQILGPTELIGTEIRSCKDEYLIPTNGMQAKIKTVASKQGLQEPSADVVNLLSHALHERLKSLVEKLSFIAQHRTLINIKTDNRYELIQDVKGQLKFLEELDDINKKRREDSEREIIRRAAKSNCKNDSDKAELRAKAKEMQRIEFEKLRRNESNQAALQALGPRKKFRMDKGAGATLSTEHGQLLLRARVKRINTCDMRFLLEHDKETSHSYILFESYRK